MKQKDTETVFQLALPHLIKANLIPEVPSEEDLSWGRKLIALYQKEMSYAGEIVPLSEMFFKEMPALGEEEQQVINGEQVPELMTHLFSKLEALEPFEAAEIKRQLKKFKRNRNKRQAIIYAYSCCCNSQMHGPELPNTIEVLGKEKC